VKLLLDTHVFIWWSDEPERLPGRVLEAIGNPGNELVLSAASILEMHLKIEAAKLDTGLPLQELVRDHEREDGSTVLPVRASHVYALRDLPRLHKDPLDRLLIAQAVVEGAALVSGDEDIRRYPGNVLW
jgi:PIN domain nuclease of toxin-antitoxin system